MIKLKYRQIPEYRQTILQAQKQCCALCTDPVIDDAVLDHDHTTGEIRGVLHRGCNALLGKIENNMTRNRVDLGRLSKISANLIKYLVADGTDLLHPTHKTKEERIMYKKKKKKPGRKGKY